MSTNFHGVVVNRPWGYQYLLHDNAHIAAWILYVQAGASTSLHSYQSKNTSLIVLSGTVEASTLDEQRRLRRLDSFSIPPSVYYALRATSGEGAFVLHIETLSDKR